MSAWWQPCFCQQTQDAYQGPAQQRFPEPLIVSVTCPCPLPADSMVRNSSTNSLPGQMQGPGMRQVGSSLSLRSATSPRMGTQGSGTLQDGTFFGQQPQHQPQGYGPGAPGRRNLGSMSMSTGDLTALYEAQAQQARVSDGLTPDPSGRCCSRLSHVSGAFRKVNMPPVHSSVPHLGVVCSASQAHREAWLLCLWMC